MRYVCLLTLMIPILPAQDGGAIYKERCASCHDAPAGRVPALSAIKAMSGEAVYLALTSGSMKAMAEGLTTAQIFALLGYIAPTGGHRRWLQNSSGPAKETPRFGLARIRRDGTAGARELPTHVSRMRLRRVSRNRTCQNSSSNGPLILGPSPWRAASRP
jgi:hypothetical protein